MLPDVAILKAKLAILKVPWLQKIIPKSLALSLAIFDDEKNLSWRFLTFLAFRTFFTDFHPFLRIFRNFGILGIL